MGRGGLNEPTPRRASICSGGPMQPFDAFDEIRRKRDRRFKRHPAQCMRVRERSAIEAKPCIRVDECALTVDEIRDPE
jgi:hypothetical protein